MISILAIFFTVGILVNANTYLRPYFINITDFFLIFITTVLVLSFLNFRSNFKKRTIYALVIVFYFSFFLEFISIKTGFPFGYYSYSDILGLKIFETPVLVGIIWILVVLSCIAFMQKIKIWNKGIVSVLLGSILLVLLDILIEPVAIKLGYWNWENSLPPLSNYIAWFVISFINILVCKFFRVNTSRPNIGFTIFVFLIIYFSLLNILI